MAAKNPREVEGATTLPGTKSRAKTGDLRVPDNVISTLCEALKVDHLRVWGWPEGKMVVYLKNRPEYKAALDYLMRVKEPDAWYMKGGENLAFQWVLLPGVHRRLIQRIGDVL